LSWKLKETILKVLAIKKEREIEIEREREKWKRDKIVPYRSSEIIVKLIIFTIKVFLKKNLCFIRCKVRPKHVCRELN